jgi:nicotinamide-nucleotide amidase
MPENNLKQADVLDGAEAIRNPRGSAPAQWLEGTHLGRQRIIILLPGPPWELEPLFRDEFEPRLRTVLPEAFLATKEIKVAMMGESAADLKAAPIYKKHKDVQTTILAGAGEVQFHLKASGTSMTEAQQKVDALANELEDALDDAVFSSTGESLEQIVGYYLQMRGATLATAESCTGGLLAERLTRVSGSSRYYLGGAVVYSNDLKKAFAEVPPLLIAEHGAVSKEVAIAMAEGIRKKCKATLGIGITGVAGPTGGTELKPVGLVYIALADGVNKPEVVERKFLGDRDRIRHWASQQALDMVRRKLV